MASQRTFFRPHRGYQNSTQTQLGKYASETLGSGSKMEIAFKCPEGVDENDWLAAMMVDVYNNVSHLYGTMTEFCLPNKDSCRTMNAGPKYEYLWADHDRVRKPIQCSAIEYANYLFDWIDDQMTDQSVFPTGPGEPYPEHFRKIIKTMCKKLFRIYAHMYTRHHEHIELLEIYPYLNSAFKAFLYFCESYDLIDTREVAPLREHIRNNLGRNYKQPFRKGSSSSSPHGRPRIQYAKSARNDNLLNPSSTTSTSSSYTPTNNNGGNMSPLGEVSTPMSVIYHPDEESVSISQSPSSHLQIISEPTETDFEEDLPPGSSMDEYTTDGGSSPTATICVRETSSDRPSVGRVSMSTTSSSNASSNSSSTTPTPDEIKQRFSRLKKKYLEDDKEAPSRSGKYSSEPSSHPVESDPTQPPALQPLHNGDIGQEPVEEPRRVQSPRQQLADYQQSKHSEDEIANQIRFNKDLQKHNDELQDRLFSAEKEITQLRDELGQARSEIHRLKRLNEEQNMRNNNHNSSSNRSYRNIHQHHQGGGGNEEEDQPFPAASPLPPPIEPPSPIAVSLVTPSPNTPPLDHQQMSAPPKSAPSSARSAFVPPKHQQKTKTKARSYGKPRSATVDGVIPPPPPLPRSGVHRSSISPRRMRVNAFPKTPQPTVARHRHHQHQQQHEEKYEQLKSLADYSQSARIIKPRQAHGPPGRRDRSNSNPKRAFIIRRRNMDKPPPQRALPKLPRG